MPASAPIQLWRVAPAEQVGADGDGGQQGAPQRDLGEGAVVVEPALVEGVGGRFADVARRLAPRRGPWLVAGTVVLSAGGELAGAGSTVGSAVATGSPGNVPSGLGGGSDGIGDHGFLGRRRCAEVEVGEHDEPLPRGPPRVARRQRQRGHAVGSVVATTSEADGATISLDVIR